MYFRADMNEIIASGHVMRCLAIAEGFKKKGEDSTFILSDDNAVGLIESRGFKTFVINTDWRDMEGEIHTVSAYIKEHDIKKIIVDSYGATGKYLKSLNEITSVVYIDDLCRQVYDVDVLLSFTMWGMNESYYENYKKNNTKLLIGTKYVPLREEFRNIRKNVNYEDRHTTYDIMITTGGTDTYNVAGRLIECLRKKYPELNILVLSSKIDIGLSDDKLTVIRHTDSMAELMTSSKVIVSAAGGTLYEVCACSVPTVTFSFADNQLEFAKRMSETGAVIYVGDARTNENIIHDISENAYKLINDKKQCGIMIEKMSDITDGCGVDRIVEKIQEFRKRLII